MPTLPSPDVYRSVLASIEHLDTERLALPRQTGKKAFAAYAPANLCDESADLPNSSLTYTGHPQLEFVAGVQGCAELAMAGERYALSEGDLAIVPPGTPHLERILSPRQNYHLLWMCVWPDRLSIHSTIYNRADRFQVVRRAQLRRRAPIWRCMESAADEAADRSPYWIHLVRARLAEGLVLALRQIEDHGPGLTPVQEKAHGVDAAKAFMQAHFCEELSLDRIAAKAGLSASYFSDLFSRTENRTVIEYLHELRIGEARRLLADTSLPIKQIARRVAMTTPAYFCRVFRRVAGVSPQEFRDLKIGQR